MKSFDRAAQTYESFGFIQREMAAWLAEWLPNERTGTAIEVGAGTGMFTQRILPWAGRFLATDASLAMIAQGSTNWPQANWQVTRADQLPSVFADWIFSASFLQWADDPVALLRHWKRRLNPGGRIQAGLFVAPSLPELAEVLPRNSPLQWRTPEQWEECMRAAGLGLVRSEAIRRVFIFPSALQLLRTLHGVGAAPVRQTSASVLRNAIKEYDIRFSQQNGVRSTWTFCRFEAENPTRQPKTPR